MEITMIFYVNDDGIWTVKKKGKRKLGGGRGNSMIEALTDYMSRYPSEVVAKKN